MKMSNEYLPTDAEFLESLFEAPSNHSNPADDPAFLKETVEVLTQKNAIPSDTDPEEFVRAMFDPQRNFRGFKSGLLVAEARKTLPQPEHYLLDTPLGFLHLQELNGFAARTPRGNAAIILNLGILLHAHMLGRCMLALTTWSSPKPFCKDHEPSAFVHAIVCLGRFAHTGNYDHLRHITVWNCPSIDSLDIESAKISSAVELFVLLHEYGHVACGHLDSSLMTKKLGVDVYTQSHAQEHEADEFAFTHHQARFGADFTGVIAALLFRFFDLIEHIAHGRPTSSSSHPAGSERWKFLKEHCRLRDPEGELFGRVDSMFDMILSVYSKIDGVIANLKRA